MEHDSEMAPPIPSNSTAAVADAAADDWAALDDFEEKSPDGYHSHPPAAAEDEAAPLAPPAEGIPGLPPDFLLRPCGSERWI